MGGEPWQRVGIRVEGREEEEREGGGEGWWKLEWFREKASLGVEAKRGKVENGRVKGWGERGERLGWEGSE